MTFLAPDFLLTKSLLYLWETRLACVLALGSALIASGAAMRSRWWRAVALVGVATSILVYLPSLLHYASGLSTDSLAELDNPSWAEARFFISTLVSLLEPAPPRRVAAAWLAVAVGCASLVALTSSWTPRKRRPGLEAMGAAVFFAGLLSIGWTIWTEYERSARELAAIHSHFSGQPVKVQGKARPLHLVVYIGESTSTMNMQLYGYLRENTPKLQSRRLTDSGMVVFDRVFSTHVHTSPSLMDALGVPRGPSAEAHLPVYERHYESLIDVLQRSGVSTALLSNQGRHGTWNVGDAVVFQHAGAARYSVDSTLLGNNESRVPRPFDSDFFIAELPSVWRQSGPQAIFLHSYAGHGPYLQNIPPEFRQPIDRTLKEISAHGVVGESLVQPELLVNEVESYDSAIRYVDHSVDRQVADLATKKEPAILLYFSDHGDSPWTGRGHDSARVVHEMLRVPLFIYFNAAARQSYPDLFKELSSIAQKKSATSLNMVAGTILKIFDLQTTPEVGSLKQDATHSAPRPLVVRPDHATGRWASANPFSKAPRSHEDQSDVATKVFRARELMLDADAAPTLCYHRADNLARARRGSLVADCLEIDIAAAPNGVDIEVYHPPAVSTGLKLDTLLDMAADANVGLWLDAKDLPLSHCAKLTQQLKRWMTRPGTHGPVMIEFSPLVDSSDPLLGGCSKDLRAVGTRTSYYVPTEEAIACTKDLGVRMRTSPACARLNLTLNKVIQSGKFTDLSFDRAGLPAVRAFREASTLRWNTWGLPPDEVTLDGLSGFGLVIADVAGDPNQY